MSDISIRIAGRAGRITLQRPGALNALTYQMCLEIERALDAWRDDPAVDLVIIDAEGDKAFCAGGDLAEMYRSGRAGDYGYGRRFWADEYRLNAKVAAYPKPYVALMQGYTMGGGVGVSCHGSHRVVCENSQIAMPECGIGLIPDVGGSLLLARAAGLLGSYLGASGHRMWAGDAILAGFADHYVPRDRWADLVTLMEETGSADLVQEAAQPAPESGLPLVADDLNAIFAADSPAALAEGLAAAKGDFGEDLRTAIGRQSPLSVACCLEVVRRVRTAPSMEDALRQEYRYTYRCMEHGDFLEGIRAQIIDKDRRPNWRHDGLAAVTVDEVDGMLSPLGEAELELGGVRP